MLRMRPTVTEQVQVFMAEVAALHRSLHDVGEAVAAAAGLTYTPLGCPREVVDEPRSVAAVAARQGVARQGVQRTADGLVRTDWPGGSTIRGIAAPSCWRPHERDAARSPRPRTLTLPGSCKRPDSSRRIWP